MKYLYIIVLVFSIASVSAQNVGQEGDTLLNYTDINGLKQGMWKQYYYNGNLKYEAYFIDGKPVGELKRYDKGGNLYAVLMNDTISNYSRAKFFHKSGKIMATGNYYGKLKDSVWNYYDDNGILYLQESYNKGKKNGVFRNYTSEGVVLEEIEWKDDVKNGFWRRYYTNGSLKWESTYVDGKMEGKGTAYYENGKVYKEGYYKNDLMEGTWLKYNRDGSLKSEYHYKKGFSPEADKENEEDMKELYNNIGKYQGPKNANDIEWLKGR